MVKKYGVSGTGASRLTRTWQMVVMFIIGVPIVNKVTCRHNDENVIDTVATSKICLKKTEVLFKIIAIV